MKLEQAARQALEALELFGTDDMAYIKSEKAITALREALYNSGEANEMVGCAYCNNPLFAGTKCNNCGRVTLAEQDKPLYRKVLREMLDTHEQAEQEPVAKPMDKAERENWYKEVIATTEDVIAEKERIAEHRALITRNNAIIAASQQPVKELELTDDEVAKAYMECTGGDIIARCRAVIAADREKNK